MISVVIPLYNKIHTIERCLNSILEQSYYKYEIIIVDDGSTDNGADIINRKFDLPNLTLFRQDNAGVSVARNKGVELSSYDYVAFLVRMMFGNLIICRV